MFKPLLPLISFFLFSSLDIIYLVSVFRDYPQTSASKLKSKVNMFILLQIHIRTFDYLNSDFMFYQVFCLFVCFCPGFTNSAFLKINSVFVFIYPQLPSWISQLVSRVIFLFPKYLMLKFLNEILLKAFDFLKMSLFHWHLRKIVFLGM